MAQKSPPNSNPGPAKKGDKPKQGSQGLILGSIGLILLLGLLQIFFLLTMGSPKLKPLDPDNEIELKVLRILDLDFPFLNDSEFESYLEGLSLRIGEKLGYRVKFVQSKKVISDEYTSAHDIFTDSKAAETWFESQLAVSKGWQTNFNWLSVILQDRDSRLILESYYGTNNLHQRIVNDFSAKISKLIELRDHRDNRIFQDSRRQALSSTAWWIYLLGKQGEADFVVANYPIFYPSALTPVDAVTRGGLVNGLLVHSSRQLGMAAAVSTWPVLRKQTGPLTREAQAILVELSTQTLGRALLRQGFEPTDKASLFFPALGNNLKAWYNEGSRVIVNSIEP